MLRIEIVCDSEHHLLALERDDATVTFATSKRINNSLTQRLEVFIAVIWILLTQHVAHEVVGKWRMNAKALAAVTSAQRRAISLYSAQRGCLLLVFYFLSFIFWVVVGDTSTLSSLRRVPR